jgi:hypothetical protein
MRTLILSAALSIAAATAHAQAHLTAAKKAAQNSAGAATAHVESMQRPESDPVKVVASAQPKTAAVPTVTPKATPTASAAKPQQPSSKGVERPGGQLNVPTTDTTSPPPSILREVFEYAKDGRRDPFVSLLTTSELRPTMSDLRLTSIVVDLSGRNSLATLRDVASNARYTVHVGSTLGRMRVNSIRGSTVVLTIDEFGTTRQDSLVLRDSTKVRKP